MASLVTGGAGFVGSHLVDRLVREGDHVVVFDDLSTGRLANLAGALRSPRVTLVYQDVAVPALQLAAALDHATRHRIERIFHLASPASPEAYGAHPWETLAVNGLGTMALIELALERGASLLFASTSEVYGDPLVHPQPEGYFGNVNPIGPRACYDEGKRFGEAAMSIAIRHRGLTGAVVRLFNCYGPRMALADGRLIPSLLAAACENAPLPLHGDGTQTRSLTYVDDVVEGILVVARNASADDLAPVNLGSEEERSVEDVARAVAAAVGVPFAVERLPARPEDPQRRRPDIARARGLGWAPRTNLEQGLARTLAWARSDALAFA